MNLKYKLLKAIDVAGLNFLRPVILLCYREEPKEQIRQIGLFIFVPVLAFCLFLFLWDVFAPLHKTKSGEVPTPSVVWDSAKGVWLFHIREENKELAYSSKGEVRENLLSESIARLAEIEPLSKRAKNQLEEADAAYSVFVATKISPITDEYDRLKKKYRNDQKGRLSALSKTSTTVAVEDRILKDQFLKEYKQHLYQTEVEKEHLRMLKSQQDAVRSEVFPQRLKAIKAQTIIAEEKQYLMKLVDTLQNSQEEKLSKDQSSLASQTDSFYAATGKDLLKLAKSITKTESRIENTVSSSYAKPMTLPDQVLRSVACVFLGFVIASIIAIPLGIICGLSKIFMAAITPFIALFKPVSPIVWLPIFFIIVGGFIPDPDKHWLMGALANAPLIGWMKINPAFIASAMTVAMCSLWPTLVNTAFGVASIDKDHINVARVLRLGFWSRLFKIVIPSSLPLTFAGLRISLGVGWMVLIAAELLSSSEGLGKFVWDMFNNGSSQTFAQMFVVVFVVGIIGLLLDRIMIVFQRLVSFEETPSAL